MALTNEQLNAVIDQSLRPEAEKLRALKVRLDSVLARCGQYTDYPDTTDPISLTRPDAASLPTLTQQDMRNFVYALGALQTQLDTIADALVEKFCVRSIEVTN